jgi:hypothetical protein
MSSDKNELFYFLRSTGFGLDVKNSITPSLHHPINAATGYRYLSSYKMTKVSIATQTMQKYADESVFALEDWEHAVAVMQEWLDEHKLTIGEQELLHYIACCAEGNAATPALCTLEEVTRDYLETYGCQTAKPLV